MADQQLSSLTSASSISDTDIAYIVNSPYGLGDDRKATLLQIKEYAQGNLQDQINSITANVAFKNAINTFTTEQIINATLTATEYKGTWTGNSISASYLPIANNLTAFTSSVLIAQGTATKEPTGFPVRSSSFMTLAGSAFSIFPSSGGSFSYYIQGQKLDVSSTNTVTVPLTIAPVYISFSNSGSLTASEVFFNLETNAPVAIVCQNLSLGGILYDERHGCIMDSATHAYLHKTFGTQYISGFAISNFITQAASPINSDNTFAVASGVIADEDLYHTLTGITSGNYTIFRRYGAGAWEWSTANSLPFLYSTNIQYNILSGTGWGQAELTNATSYVNYYLGATPAINQSYQLILIQGQNYFLTTTLAYSDNFANLSTGNLPVTEFALLYKITFKRNNAYTSTGKVNIDRVERITGFNLITTSGVSPTNHNALSGRTDPDQHPATAISVDASSFVGGLSTTATTVQLALTQIDSAINNILSVSTITGAISLTANSNPLSIYLCDASTLDYSINLPVPSTCLKKKLTFKRTDANTNYYIRVAPNSTEKIEGFDYRDLLGQYDMFSVVTNAIDWFII